jgi:hypothetical protein
VYVIDFLASVVPCVEDNPIAILGEAEFLRGLFSLHQHLARQKLVFFGKLSDRSNVLLWNDQKMYRGLRMNVFEN